MTGAKFQRRNKAPAYDSDGEAIDNRYLRRNPRGQRAESGGGAGTVYKCGFRKRGTLSCIVSEKGLWEGQKGCIAYSKIH